METTKETYLSWSEWLANHQFEQLVDIPEDVLKRNWTPNISDRMSAWELYTELRTRIATQPLHFLDGEEIAALTSIYELFPTTRTLIRRRPMGTHFAELSVYFLNQILRPFTSKWYRWSLEGHLENEHTKNEFRTELGRLQKKLQVYCLLLGYLAEGEHYINVGDDAFRSPILEHDLILEPPLMAPESVATTGFKWSFKNLLTKDQLAIQKRREYYRLQQSGSSTPPGNTVGLAISGGGIRSATLSVGVLQRLAPTGILREVDLLSTVSGGGYTGSFLSTFLSQSDASSDEQTANDAPKYSGINNTSEPKIGLNPDDDEPFGDSRTTSAALSFLRNHSQELLSGGITGMFRAVAQIIYGIFVQFFALAFVLISVGLVFHTIVGLVGEQFTVTTENALLILDVVLIIAIVLWFLSLIALPVIQSLRQPVLTARWEKTTRIIGLAVAVIAIFAGLVHWHQKLVTSEHFWIAIKTLSFSVVLVPLTLGILGAIIGLSRKLGTLLLQCALPVGTAIGLLLLFFIFIDIAKDEQSQVWKEIDMHLPYALSAFVAIVLMYVSFFFLNLNYMTLHRFYRNRLAQAYIIKFNRSDNEIKAISSPKLSDLKSATHKMPYHLINTTLNGSSNAGTDLYRRGADFFVFTPDYYGSESTGYWSNETLEKSDPEFSLATAMAVSGAAISPNMGTMPLSWARKILSVFNLRLNYWLPKPSQPVTAQSPKLRNLYNEYRGNVNIEEDDFFNLSDGGHIENLGLYELIKRRCKFIIAIDGEADAAMTRASLNKIVRLARQDFNANIDIKTASLELDDKGMSRTHFSFGKITYYNAGPNDTGYLLYIKTSLTGNEPADVIDYRRRHPTFPHQTTADQFFDEEQFEAYRALGHHIAAELLAEENVGALRADGHFTVQELFQQLANQSYPKRWEDDVADLKSLGVPTADVPVDR